MALRCLLFGSIDLERKQGHGELGFKVICCALLDGFSGCYFALFCFSSHCHTPSREDQLKREKGYFDSLFQPRAECTVFGTEGKVGTS